jgi:hypothetical protein
MPLALLPPLPLLLPSPPPPLLPSSPPSPLPPPSPPSPSPPPLLPSSPPLPLPPPPLSSPLPSSSSSPSSPLYSSYKPKEFSSSEETSDSSDPLSPARSTKHMYVQTSAANPWESSESSNDVGGEAASAIPQTRRKLPSSTPNRRSPPREDLGCTFACRQHGEASLGLSCLCP